MGLRHFCTLFNSFYQYHAQVLYESISAADNTDKRFYFFCFDNASLEYFRQYNAPNIQLISVQELEGYFPDLLAVKPQRSIAEYFFTSTPAVCKYVMENYPEMDELVYLDADLYFYQSPEILFKEIGNSSVSIISHRFNLLNSFRNIYGYYNVGWISFRRDKDGLACMNKWFDNTVEWCYDKLTWKRYADQKYLNYWNKEFSNVYAIKNKGANVAPWNVGNYKISSRSGELYVDEMPLIFYHFASLKVVEGAYYTTISSYFSTVSKEIIELIYKPYISRLIQLGFVPRVSVRLNTNPLVTKLRRLIRRFFKDSIVIPDLEKSKG
ncbi:MAG TPA: hypothetical protein VHN59_14455 [Chitinophagaceae bacterium]|nr:hypothetical protein [Chitinophagaceae bacterium]